MSTGTDSADALAGALAEEPEPAPFVTFGVDVVTELLRLHNYATEHRSGTRPAP